MTTQPDLPALARRAKSARTIAQELRYACEHCARTQYHPNPTQAASYPGFADDAEDLELRLHDALDELAPLAAQATSYADEDYTPVGQATPLRTLLPLVQTLRVTPACEPADSWTTAETHAQRAASLLQAFVDAATWAAEAHTRVANKLDPNPRRTWTFELADRLVEDYGWKNQDPRYTDATPTPFPFLTRGELELDLTDDGWFVTDGQDDADGTWDDSPSSDPSLAAWNLDDVLTSFEESIGY